MPKQLIFALDAGPAPTPTAAPQYPTAGDSYIYKTVVFAVCHFHFMYLYTCACICMYMYTRVPVSYLCLIVIFETHIVFWTDLNIGAVVGGVVGVGLICICCICICICLLYCLCQCTSSKTSRLPWTHFPVCNRVGYMIFAPLYSQAE